MTDLTSSQLEELVILRAIVENSPDQIIIASASGIILDVYPGKERMFTLDASKMIGKHFTELYSPRFSEIIFKVISNVLENNNPLVFSYSLTTNEILAYSSPEQSEEVYWFEARVNPHSFKHFKEQVILWFARDITRKVRLEKEIKFLADHDELTKTCNRRKFLAVLAENYSQFKRYTYDTCIFMIDIDNFKDVNDTFGHPSGDKVIRHIARVCSATIRRTDVLGRLGGEEFAILLPHTDPESAFTLAERLRREIQNSPCQIEENRSINVTVSIGISQFKVSDKKDTDALSRADEAMYASKNSGRNAVTVFSD